MLPYSRDFESGVFFERISEDKMGEGRKGMGEVKKPFPP